MKKDKLSSKVSFIDVYAFDFSIVFSFCLIFIFFFLNLR